MNKRKLFRGLGLVSVLLTLLLGVTVIANATPIQQEEATHYYIGQWIWTSDVTGPHWEPAYFSDTKDVFDLRSLPQMGTQGPGPQCCGLFVLKSYLTDPDLLPVYLGSDLTATVSDLSRSLLESTLKVGALPRSDLASTIWELLVFRGDVTGDTRWKPVTGLPGKLLEFSLGGQVLREEPFSTSHPAWPVALALFQEDYRKTREYDLENGSTHYLKVLDAAIKNYGVSKEILLAGMGAEIESETPSLASTVISDDFDCADSDTFGCDLAWTEVQGDWDILGNEANKQSSGQGSARANSALSDDSHFTQITWEAGTTSGYNGVATRYAAAATTFYICSWWPGIANMRISKMVAGARTDLVDAGNGPVAGDTIRLTSDTSLDPDHDCAVEGITETSTNDSSITGNVRCGVAAHDDVNAAKSDNFTCDDGVAAAARRFFITEDSKVVTPEDWDLLVEWIRAEEKVAS